jgi:hypothetical protein
MAEWRLTQTIVPKGRIFMEETGLLVLSRRDNRGNLLSELNWRRNALDRIKGFGWRTAYKFLKGDLNNGNNRKQQ